MLEKKLHPNIPKDLLEIKPDKTFINNNKYNKKNNNNKCLKQRVTACTNPQEQVGPTKRVYSSSSTPKMIVCIIIIMTMMKM